jgi:hypothetical protein
MIRRNLLPAARQTCARAPCHSSRSTLISTSALRPISILSSRSCSQDQHRPQLQPNLLCRRYLNSAASSHTPQLVSKHELGSVPSPAESVGEFPIKKSEKKRGKLWDSADEAVKDLKSGSVILSAGESMSSDEGVERMYRR